jgi:hypothetical protein
LPIFIPSFYVELSSGEIQQARKEYRPKKIIRIMQGIEEYPAENCLRNVIYCIT